MCKVLKLGDEIIQIDGYDTPTKEAIMLLLRGSDVPGSNVVLTVKKVYDCYLILFQNCPLSQLWPVYCKQPCTNGAGHLN